MDSLICNVLNAVVTSCSHIFCVDCANSLLGSPASCYICQTKLEDSNELVEALLQPSDTWKTTILAGLSPPIVIDIASRALSFWTYQQDHEKMFQTMLASNANQRVTVLEKELGEARRKNESDTMFWKGQVANLGKDLEMQKRKTQQVKEVNASNAKAYAKLKANNEQLRQQILHGGTPMSASNAHYSAPHPSPAPLAAARRPFVPATSLPPRAQSSAGQPQLHAQQQQQAQYSPHDENYYAETFDSSSTRPFVPNGDHVLNGGGGGGERRSRASSSSRDRHSADADQSKPHYQQSTSTFGRHSTGIGQCGQDGGGSIQGQFVASS
ncbi:hypothetical protein JCM16303_004051 [Sporobolomyces ruberrimus]